jgi:NitT/TauT family transport system substrate-binding protein
MQSSMFRRQTAACAGAVLAFGLIASGCSHASGAAASGGNSSHDTISIQVPPIADAAPLYLAEKNGLFKKQGLNVKITIGQGGAAIAAALQSGSTDLGMVNYVSAISGISKGLPITLVADATHGTPKSFGLVVSGSSSINSIKDLKGKTVGVISTGSISDFTTNVQLTATGLSSGDVKYVNVPLPNLLSAVGNQVDAVSLNEPTLSTALARGDRLVLDAYTGPLAGMPVAGYFAASKWASSHVDILKRFAQALAEASQTANNDPSSVRAILPSYTKLDAAQVQSITLPRFAPSTDAAEVQKVADLMREHGFLQSDVVVADHVAK